MLVLLWSIVLSPMRVLLFTDTLGDINGVARFIRTAAAHAQQTGHDLTVLTSTRMAVPDAPNIVNLTPRYARAMPLYPQLELVLPSRSELFRRARQFRPDAIHVSTPGPVGLAGRSAALRVGVPLLGTYHTDFPAYLEHLGGHDSLGGAARALMTWFYRPFHAIFSRSTRYARILADAGMNPARIHPLRAGIDAAAFNPDRRDRYIWTTIPGARPGSFKVLYVGRISVEKNLPMLADLWPRVRRALHMQGIDAQLVIVGDGPYLSPLRAALAGQDALFTGIRHGEELAALYASSDLFLFPSLTDTLGQVVMEAQASGLPVLVTDRGGPREIVEDGGSGFVLPISNPQRWIDHILTLAADALQRARMGRRGRELMESRAFAASFDHFWAVHAQLAIPKTPVSAGPMPISRI